MSGLISFFRGFLYPESANNASEEAKVSEEEYRESLSSAASYRSAMALIESEAVKSTMENSPGVNAHADWGDQEQSQSPVQNDDDQAPLQLVAYNAWYEERKAVISEYMAQRLSPQQNADDQDDKKHVEEDDEEYEVPDNDGLEVPLWESQQEHIGSQEAAADTQEPPVPETPTGPTPITPNTAVSKKKKKIPHVDDTTNIITSLDSIDLDTKTIHLDLLRIDKVWSLRRSHRLEWQDSSSVGTAVPCSNGGPLALFPFKFFEDDGPIGTLFKNVISIEVTQLDAPETLELREAAAAAFGGVSKPSRLRIFFYGMYAKHVSRFLAGSSDASTRLLSLQNVPAMCVLPYQRHSSSWYDQETLSEFCICIGDKSTMRRNVCGEMVPVRFDCEELKIKLASQEEKKRANDGTFLTREVHIDPKRLPLAEIRTETTSNLVNAYQDWQTSHQPNNKETMENGLVNQDPVAIPDPAPSEDPNKDATAPANTDEVEPPKETRSGSRDVGREVIQEGPRVKRAKTALHYHKLGDLRKTLDHQKVTHVEEELDIFGTVLGFGSPTRTKRGDWMISITIVDETLAFPSTTERTASSPDTDGSDVTSVTVIIFCRQEQELPRPLIAGDVLRCHRVAVQEWQGDVQIVGRRKSSYVMIRPKQLGAHGPVPHDRDCWSVVPSARLSFTFEPGDLTRAVELWHWAQERILSYPTMMKVEHRFRLSDLHRQGGDAENFHSRDEVISRDLTAMITGVLPVPPGARNINLPKGFIRVWDGTGAPRSDPLPLATSEASDLIKTGDPPSEALVAISDTINALNGDDSTENDYNAAPTRFSIDSFLEPPKCLCGCVVNVAIWEEPHWDLVDSMLGVGKFIRLRNIQDNRLASGLRCLMVSSKSQLTPLPQQTFEVRTLLEDHQKRIIRKEPYNPQSGLLPLKADSPNVSANSERAVSQGDKAPVLESSAQTDSRLNDSKGRENSLAQCIAEPPGSFHVTFRIVRTVPDVDEKEVGLRSLCVASKGDSSRSVMEFHFGVHLSDGTGQFDAVLSNELAASLLGKSADEACESSYPATQILHVMTRRDSSWNGKIRSVLYKGEKFFILESASIAKHGDGLHDLVDIPRSGSVE